jgi:ABC-type Fe3+-hydroxamate transport system substrate-binding protein
MGAALTALGFNDDIPASTAWKNAVEQIATALANAEREGMKRAAEQIEELQDKIDGLSADLDNAVAVAYHRGALDWTRLNYPEHFARFEAGEDAQ